jgi:hypothetical protein
MSAVYSAAAEADTQANATLAARAKSGHWVVGWKLERNQRGQLLQRFPPKHAFTVADHVTLRAKVAKSTPLPQSCRAAEIVGHVDDGKGVEAMIVAIDGSTERPDGGTYHITWSLGPQRRARESNDIIADRGWTSFADPIPIELQPAAFQ